MRHTARRVLAAWTLLGLVTAGPIGIEATANASTPLSLGNAATTYLEVGCTCTTSLTATGGTPPYHFALAQGSLPPGTALAGDGTVGGTPGTVAIYRPSITLTDSTGASVTHSVSIPVGARSNLTNPSNNSENPSISADGTRVAYVDQTSNPQILVLNRTTGTTIHATVDSKGNPEPGIDGSQLALSANGQYLLFKTDTWEPDGVHTGLWIKNMSTGTLQYVGAARPGASTMTAQAVSDTGTVAAYSASSDNVVHIVNLSADTDLTPALCLGDNTGMSHMTPDGHFVVFEELSPSCLGPTTEAVHTVLYDVQTGAISDIGECACRDQNSPGSVPRQPGISGDGRYVSYFADNVAGYPAGDFLYDTVTSTTTSIPMPTAPGHYDGDSELSDDGQRVVVNGYNLGSCVDDLPQKTLTCVGTGAYGDPALTGDGQYLAYTSLSGENYAIGLFEMLLAQPTIQTVLSLGDSIAAGEGLGLASGYPDNTKAYPAELAHQLGATDYNFAISGACAGSTGNNGAPNTCTKSVLTNELPNAAAQLHRAPDLVTLTVGADDIQFSNCFKGVLGLQASNPCTGSAFTTNRGALAKNLSSTMRKVNASWPAAQKVVTTYFNPFPPGSEPCALTPLLYLYKQLVVDRAYKATVTTVVIGKLAKAATAYQQQLYNTALGVINVLNQTIADVATQNGWTVAPLDVANHDYCQDYGSAGNGWVFGPLAYFSATFRLLGVASKSVTLSLHPTDRCTPLTPVPPATSCDSVKKNIGPLDKSGAGYSAEWDGYFGSNDTPHLTPAGSVQAAKQVISQLH